MSDQQQHVLMYRKLLLRRHLLRWAVPGPAFVPFIGDGDIAYSLYRDRTIYGADLDPARVVTASSRLSGDIRVADCDSWPFPDLTDEIAVADFDAYVEPYIGFRSFWSQAPKKDRMVMFFTDGRRQGLLRSGSWTKPDGSKVLLKTRVQKSVVANNYLGGHIWPWFESHVAPLGYKVIDRWRYQRSLMIYWGAAIER
jgi:hypothetical protein